MRFELLDVFGEGAWRGATAAVFRDVDHIDVDTMARISRGLGVGCAAFVQRARREGCAWRVRFVAQGRELPLSAVGALAAAEALATVDHEHIVIETGVTATELTRGADRRWSMALPPAVVGHLALEDRAAVASAVGLTAHDLDDARPVSPGSCGIGALLVPVRDVAALSRVKMHPDAWLRAVEKAKLLGALVCARDGDVVRARFVGVAGVAEEVGWGLTAAPVARWYGAQGAVVRYGVETGRDARVSVEVGDEPTLTGAVTRIG